MRWKPFFGRFNRDSAEAVGCMWPELEMRRAERAEQGEIESIPLDSPPYVSLPDHLKKRLMFEELTNLTFEEVRALAHKRRGNV